MFGCFIRALCGAAGAFRQRLNLQQLLLGAAWTCPRIPEAAFALLLNTPSVHNCQRVRFEVEVLTFFLFLRSQKELREKQSEMVKTVTAAENAINKLQLNTVSIEVSGLATSVAQCFMRRV